MTTVPADFFRMNLVAAILIAVLRIMEHFSLAATQVLPYYAIQLQIKGLVLDGIGWLILSGIAFIPFVLFSLIHRRAGIIFMSVVILLAALAEWSLFTYFRIALAPLDQVVYTYTIRDLYQITASSVPLGFTTFLPHLFLLLLGTGLILLSLKIRIWRISPLIMVVLIAGAFHYRSKLDPKFTSFRNKFDYNIVLNKTSYFVRKSAGYFGNRETWHNIDKVREAARRYHAANPEIEYKGLVYPFLHTDDPADVLGPFFNFNNEPPNLVFIIVESLSSCFICGHPAFGSFTPFIDSLAQHSLYWSNFLSTSDRTFNVLPAMFASLPPGDPSFVNVASRIPNHLSLIRYLRESGYYASFFYPSDPEFNYMQDFLKKQGTDYILRSFGPRYKRFEHVHRDYGWGYPDADLFSRSFEVIDSVKRSPRLDIYLTLSLHSPFIVPDQGRYLALLDRLLAERGNRQPGREMVVKNRNIFSTILYVDNALREFMKKYREQPGYDNTIFIITGDHGLPELNLFRYPAMLTYNVPLIIYSPMLKKPGFFRSVSSHLDITPSFLAMMRDNFRMKTAGTAAWLGSGIDTAREPRNVHTLPFVMNGKEIVEYLKHDHFLSVNQVRKLLPDLWLSDDADPVAKKQLMQELNDFRILNTYVTRQNRLIPPELLIGKAVQQAELSLPVQPWIDSADSVWEYHTLVQDMVLSDNLKFLGFRFSFDIMTSETDTSKAPVIVMDLTDELGKSLVWQAMKLPCYRMQPSGSSDWKKFEMEDFADISYVSTLGPRRLKLYIWNQYDCIVRFGNPNVVITGYF